MILTFIGSGGKTTSIFSLAKQLRLKKKTVLITTTTQMYTPAAFSETGRTLPCYEEAFCCLSGSLKDIQLCLRTHGICLAGLPSRRYPSTKLSALPETIYHQACALADFVLVEADGARGMLLKYPSSCEPVIPPNTDLLYLLYNSRAIGKPLSQVTFRLSLALDCLNQSGEFSTPCTKDTLVSPHIIRVLYRIGYITPLKLQFSDLPLYLLDGNKRAAELASDILAGISEMSGYSLRK